MIENIIEQKIESKQIFWYKKYIFTNGKFCNCRKVLKIKQVTSARLSPRTLQFPIVNMPFMKFLLNAALPFNLDLHGFSSTNGKNHSFNCY